jgi:hypothetical protein
MYFINGISKSSSFFITMYKLKEDGLAHLSDQLLVLRERIQQLERK